MSVTGIVDFHSHLIPAVDDGAATVHQSLEALGAFAGQGAAACITTPHFDASITKSPRLFEQRLAEFDRGWAELTAAHAKTTGLPAIHRGVELMLDDPDPLLNDERIRLAGTAFVLCEFPSMQLPPNAEWAMHNLRQKGWRPIIAHPERYRNHDPHMSTLARCRAAGAALQVNAGSLLGQHGERAKSIAVVLLQHGWVDYLASDHHARGAPATGRAVAWLEEQGAGAQAARLTRENPARILTGEPPLPVEPLGATKARPSFWARLLGRR
jgi:protein-tyrosine phosphatase